MILMLFLLVLFILSFMCLYKNRQLKTSIYRKLFRHPWYFISEDDNLYSFGYAGVEKFQYCNGRFSRICKNSSFCYNCIIGYLIARSGAITGDYLYVATRSFLGGLYKSKKRGYKKGALLIMNKSTLKIVKRIDVDYSMIEIKKLDNCMVVSGLQGFNVYNIENALEPRLTFSFRTTKAWEYQGTEIFMSAGRRYVAFARFDYGLSIYDISDISNVCHFLDIKVEDMISDCSLLTTGLQQFQLKLDYPYLYSTLGPTPGAVGTKNEKRGILVFDISDMKNIKKYPVFIPCENWYNRVNGDPQPSQIDVYGDFIYTNFSEKGIAVFMKSNNHSDKVRFLRIINVADGKQILPIHINNKGVLFMGDFRRNNIYTYNLNG